MTSIRDPVLVADAEHCAQHLRRFAAEPDTAEARLKIDTRIDDYLVRGGVRQALASAFAAADVPDSPLTAFIRTRLASEAG